MGPSPCLLNVCEPLFYLLSRYLRITVPLGLAVAVYVGLVPLLLTGSMGAAALATQEAEYCKQVQYSTVQYSTVQYSTVQYSTVHAENCK